MASNIRIPRPMGSTQLALDYQKQGSPELLDSLHSFIINTWLMSNNTLCGIAYDTNSFSLRFNIPISKIKEYMRDKIVSCSIWNPEQSEQLMQGLLGEQLMWAIEDRNEIAQQASILKTAQGGVYKPFISAEYNKALKLRLESTGSLQQMIRNLTGGGTVNIFQQFNQQNNIDESTTNNSITIEEARALIMESQQSLPKSEEVRLIETNYDLKSLPVVVANDQKDVDTSKEGLNVNAIELNSITDDYKASIESSDRDHHEMRREIQMGYNQDYEDPELDIYEDVSEEPEDFSISSQFLNS